MSLAERKAKVIELRQKGLSREDACAAVDRKWTTYEDWMRKDPSFNAAINAIRDLKIAAHAERPEVPDFPQFCEELGQPLHPHQRMMWEVLQGKQPSKMHSSFVYREGQEVDPYEGQDLHGRLICNLPPGHGKTTTFSINMVTWLIHKNPNLKIIVVCKDQALAKQILGAVKSRLTSSIYRDIQNKYAPEQPDGTYGWKDGDASWTATEIYVKGKGDGEKDPTVQALGIGGRIYGARSDIIILDDAVTLANVNEYEKQTRWLDREVESRLDGGGLLALFGTRLNPIDLYKHLREIKDADDVPVYTYFSMPAVLEERDDEWLTLWPYECDRRESRGAELRCLNCYDRLCLCKKRDMRWMTPKFTRRRLSKIRRDQATWALVYQQQDVAEDATFNHRAIEASINSVRFPGVMKPGVWGHRANGMDGLYVIGGLDPAAGGNTAMIVMGVDRPTQKRYILDGVNQRNASAEFIQNTIKRLTEQYGIHEWLIEATAVQRYISQDPAITTFLRSRGCRLTPHYTTTANKPDPDFGVIGLAPLFLTCGEPPMDGAERAWKKTPEKALIELPNQTQNAWVQELINQLTTWQPSGLGQLHKTDLVMALWFANIAANKILGFGKKAITHLNNPYASRGDLQKRRTINLADYKAQKAEGAVA